MAHLTRAVTTCPRGAKHGARHEAVVPVTQLVAQYLYTDASQLGTNGTS